MTFGTIAASAGVLLALSATNAVVAAPALATNNVNLRQGPGTTYTVILTIPGGSNVDVGGCSGQWCQVTFQGQNGYAIATSFDQGGGAPPPGVAGPPPAGYAGPPAGPPPAGYAPPPPGYAGPPPGVDPDAPIPVYPGAPPPIGPPIYVGPPPPAYYFYGNGPYYGPYGGGYYYRRW